MQTKFCYEGFTFVPVRAFTPRERHEVRTGRIWDRLTAGETFFWRENGWDWEAFYRVVPRAFSQCDVFHCEETETDYVPASRCLFKIDSEEVTA